MIKKIKSSLWLKIFLVQAVLLFSVSFLLYGIVMTVMPASYENLADKKIKSNTEQLIQQLENSTVDEASGLLYNFCINNNVSVCLEGGDTKLSYGTSGVLNGADTEDQSAMTVEIESGVEIKLLGSDTTYVLTISTTRQIAQNITQSFWNLLPIISVVILVISLVSAYFVSHFLTKPILEISEISNRFTVLDLSCQCKTNRTDEIGVLSCNLNTMAVRLDKALKKLTKANEKLQTDIERERQQEKLRVDFFRAVSHELKTPITVLKGELEGMIYQVGEYKDRDAHLRESMCTVNEMERLVKEILSASRMAGSDFNLTISEIDLSELVRQCCRKWQGAAEDKGLGFLSDIEDICICHGDMALLQKAISNIIGNAVTHSPEKEKVTVSLKDNTLQVINSGAWIPNTDLCQVFEPFYRADPSHSRGTGGSGLGLYIVKTILDRHELKYSMENTEQGVCFTVLF
ncbi:MAG: HAMP domain-containing sensor histidine kinase [Eubacteriales bacterium]|nr:HAMP domain-containing sensor histidine kinase [Eubacteriales bacterium]